MEPSRMPNIDPDIAPGDQVPASSIGPSWQQWLGDKGLVDGLLSGCAQPNRKSESWRRSRFLQRPQAGQENGFSGFRLMNPTTPKLPRLRVGAPHSSGSADYGPSMALAVPSLPNGGLLRNAPDAYLAQTVAERLAPHAASWVVDRDVDGPLYLSYPDAQVGEAQVVRWQLEIGPGVHAFLVEEEGSHLEAFRQIAGDIIVRSGGRLDHLVVRSASPSAAHGAALGPAYGSVQLRSMRVVVEAGAQWNGCQVQLMDSARGESADDSAGNSGRALGAIERSEWNVELLGGSAEFRAICHVTDAAQAEMICRLFHRTAGGRSDTILYGLATGQAEGHFLSTVDVAEGAKGTASNQSLRTLLGSDHARFFARPELWIACDDVECHHGYATAHVDGPPMFYLRSRGIDPTHARALLTRAFLRGGLSSLAEGPMRVEAEAAIDQLFPNPFPNPLADLAGGPGDPLGDSR